MALRNNSTVEDQAKNIIATVLGYITKREPLEYDEIKIDIKRLKKEAPTESQYASRKIKE
jgi:transcriptional regulator of NAD metabolism